jgi:fructokinase
VNVFGAIEAGGPKFVCGVGSGPDDLRTVSFPTTTSSATVDCAVRFLTEAGFGRLRAVGIGSFGPVDLDEASATHGFITSTPKPGWRNFDLAGAVARALQVPVGFDTDVNAAALGEARWGAARGLADFLYLTVGTGIGGGAMVNGAVIHGLVHPEMGHFRVPHDHARDPFPGVCPFHGDCLEGLASGPAIAARWGLPPTELAIQHPAWLLEAHYLAAGLAALVCTLSPRRIVMGGGVMRQRQLFPLIRTELERLLNGYIQHRALLEQMQDYVVPPELGDRAGVLGALILAEHAALEKASRSAERW